MVELAIIIGNGFDLDLGLPSKYTDFIKGKEWKELEESLRGFPNDYRNHSLIAHLHCVANSKEHWFDIEMEILNFIQNHPECSEKEEREINTEFDRLKKALKEYLLRISNGYKMDLEKYPYIFVNKLVNCNKKIVVYNYNYTNPVDFLPTQDFCPSCLRNQISVHGSLYEDDGIVLGCDIQSHQQVNRSLSFMYKYNMLDKANHVARNLLEAKEIIFYGHSVNEMDFGYFRELFKAASTAPKPTRHLTFITLNEKSERSIKDNIRNQGISVTDLYNNLESFVFIHTEKLYFKDFKELQKWDDMFKRISTKDVHGIKIRN
jgi:hypothetical protein